VSEVLMSFQPPAEHFATIRLIQKQQLNNNAVKPTQLNPIRNPAVAETPRDAP